MEVDTAVTKLHTLVYGNKLSSSVFIRSAVLHYITIEYCLHL
jgi:hypothetical protein